MRAKVRVIRSGEYPVYGIAIPKEIALLVKNVAYDIELRGTTLVLTSGCDLETIKKTAKEYMFEDVRV